MKRTTGLCMLVGVCLLPNMVLADSNRGDLMKVHRGGAARLVAKAAAGTLDPQINYTPLYWTIYQGTYDGLVTFRKAPGPEGTVIVPDLAENIPQPQNDGKTYTFKLRQGIKFSNGKDLSTDDVVASFQRIFKVSSPTSGSFYKNIIGADACLKEPQTCTLEGGVVGDKIAGTVTINLTGADPEFIDKIAMPHASIVPSETPAKDMGTIPIPGTGAYAFDAYDPNKQLSWSRNRYFKEWSVEAQPDGFIDSFKLDFGLTEEAQVNAVVNRQADAISDQPPADRLSELGTKYASQVHLQAQNALWYVPLNVNLPPFDNLKARQALAYALDLKALVNFFGGRNLASPTCQILPPAIAGYEQFCLYTKNPGQKWTAPDLEKAKQLIEESGTKGSQVTVIVDDGDVSRNIGQYLQSVLTDLGYKADVKSLSNNIHFTYIQNTNNKVQLSVTQWYSDYPAASNFINALLGCDSFTPGSDSSVNISGFCDKSLQARIDHAMTFPTADQGAAKLWAGIDKDLMTQAPILPLFTPKHLDFMSSRVGNYLYSSQYSWLWVQAWVK
ncbi:ABC transporter substrate-binding protein [Agrobacterium vitis]|uniref:ABC transporter substrate-binding protein n=1 Tax=Agrobacterium vitis TaxID=373 RepID=UPI001F2A3C23|nr:ABC transporter substrate-binding protein [Agrobacterium vitis]